MKSLIQIKLVIFSLLKGKLIVYLKDNCLPSGEVGRDECLEDAVVRVYKSNILFPFKNSYQEQLYTVSHNNKDIVSISVIYFILLPLQAVSGKDKHNWMRVASAIKKSSDKNILQYGLQRLRWKVEYTNVVYSLLPSEFTFSELQEVYETILGRRLDKRNFRKKIFSLDILKSTGKKRKIGRARPAEVFSFKKRELEYVEII